MLQKFTQDTCGLCVALMIFFMLKLFINDLCGFFPNEFYRNFTRHPQPKFPFLFPLQKIGLKSLKIIGF